MAGICGEGLSHEEYVAEVAAVQAERELNGGRIGSFD
jgi:hypothetical protein